MEEIYTAWTSVPDNLKTKTQLGKMGLRLAKDQQPVAHFCSYIRGRSRPRYYKLFKVEEAEPKRVLSEDHLQALAQARQKSQEARTCRGCGYVFPPRRLRLLIDGYCKACRHQRAASAWARAVLDDPDVLLLDTETTGLDEEDEIIEIAIIRSTGQPLLDSLVRPTVPISASAADVHGLDWLQLETAPTWTEIWPELVAILNQATRILTYGAEFDHRLMQQTCHRYGLELPPWTWECVMEQYARWYGHWSTYYNSYKWQPLHGSHRAQGDCLAALNRIKEMVHDIHDPG